MVEQPELCLLCLHGSLFLCMHKRNSNMMKSWKPYNMMIWACGRVFLWIMAVEWLLLFVCLYIIIVCLISMIVIDRVMTGHQSVQWWRTPLQKYMTRIDSHHITATTGHMWWWCTYMYVRYSTSLTDKHQCTVSQPPEHILWGEAVCLCFSVCSKVKNS